MTAGHEHYFTGRVSSARTTVSIFVAPSLVSPTRRANLAESMQSMPLYQVSSETELGTSRAESRRSSSMCNISNNYKMLILAPSSVWNMFNYVVGTVKERRLGDGSIFVFCAWFFFTHPVLPFISHEFADIWHELFDVWQGGSTGKGKMNGTKLGIS